ncbi:MAG TPA: MraY family glycosyltransferase [Bacteroidales bacterium]|nr:MraY family glycosyltransferase [Bacteroidales bacterium]HPF03754.1 MraY family glycosyltransferase [Bacteroidales bacterium]HPJ58588.1 MraY family glycosyltransferase [Bacteroidales bacterium]HPR11253.1 MraY family glycosyltransferase [Bacteroidales bacterium]
MLSEVPDILIILLGFLLAFAITFFGIPRIIRLARQKGLYDIPGTRTSHNEPTPRLGGAMIFAGVILTSVLFTDFENAAKLKYLIAGMLILFFIGIKDDIITLTPPKKILGQIFASGIIVVLGNIRIVDCYAFFGMEYLSYAISIIISILIFMALINSINLIDGIDGLAAGVGIIASVAFGTWFFMFGHISMAVICVSLLGSLIAFLYFNVFSKRNKIFLGDTGSQLIGFLLAVFAVSFLELNASIPDDTKLGTAPAITLSILIVPVIDTLRVIYIRLRNKKSIFKADHNHIHHAVLSVSKTHLIASLTILSVNITLIIFTIVFRHLGNTILIIALGILSTVLIYLLNYYRHKNQTDQVK